MCQEWIIADVNHDGTSGTVDLFSKTTLNNYSVGTSLNNTSACYSGSTLDNYLVSTVYNGFATEIKNSLNSMNVVTTGQQIIQRRIVAPSKTEFGIVDDQIDSHYPIEGTIYPIFSPAPAYWSNNKAWYSTADGRNDNIIWTRTFNAVTNGYVCVNQYGSAHGSLYNHDSDFGVVARIRFAKK